MEIKSEFFSKEQESKTFEEFLKGLNLTENVEMSLEHINEEDIVKKQLALSIERDIQQYLGDKDIWGNEKITVAVVDDDAFVVWKNYRMPTIDFYKLVSLNGGLVKPDDFEKY